MANERNYLEFYTELFFYDQADEDLDKWFIGADCAGWMFARLLPVPGIKENCEPVMEDWGWYFSMLVDEVKVAFCIWCTDGNQWVIGVEPVKGLFKRTSPEQLSTVHEKACDALEAIVLGDDRFARAKWHETNPQW